MQLRPFQQQGVEFLASSQAAILADDTGLGKSAQLITAADANLAERVLIICQAISVVSWKIELPKWTKFSRDIFLLNGKNTNIPKGPIAVIATYDFFGTREKKALAKMMQGTDRFDVVFLDEVQALKSKTAKRTQAIYGARLENNGVLTRFGLDLANPPKVFLSSATLTPNSVAELYPHLRTLFPHVLQNLFNKVATQQEFENMFCIVDTTQYGRQIRGNKRPMIPVLKQAMAPHILVRSKADVAPELGAINYLELPLDVKTDYVELAPRDGHVDFVGEELFLTQLQAEATTTAMSTARKALGEAKAKEVIPWIENFLSDPAKKLVVFAHHTAVIDMLGAHFVNEVGVARICGQTSQSMRGIMVREFQQEPSVRLFIGQTIAAGTSITLSAASDVLLIEPDWTPANNYQAISRCHRIGQKSTVNAYFATAVGTLDQRINRVLRRKAQDAEQLLGKPTGGHL
jgi:SWI/SNF-related matrix-associated actin-dependent regulator of chromatin subfamily A-like protein 1